MSKQRFVILLIAASLCGGCAAKRAAVAQPYRLMGTAGADFLLPPDFSLKDKTATETPVALGQLSEKRQRGTGNECSIKGRWFSLERDGKRENWIAELPSPSAWFGEGFVRSSHEDWSNFFDQIYDLESKSCITPEGYEMATEWIRESMPAPARLAEFFRDPLDERGFVALGADTRLFIERSIFRTPGEETEANYAGEMNVYYNVAVERGGGIGLKLHKIQRSAGLSRAVASRFPDTTLARDFGKAGAIRLFLLTRYIPPQLKRTALLVGTRNPADMVGISRKIEKSPEIPCSELSEPGIACVSFDGEVSASLELNVRVNGKEEYFPPGTKLQSVMDSVPAPEQESAWNTLKIRRLFRGRLADFDFRRDDPEVRSLTLVAGDRITWSTTKASH